ncbi:hydroxyethylthiazole kinase [Motilibacter rhizosphaerae]|uniref:Hydroxyethylthiazole kinase n=1 Tax=Motilibacter rhizosphaerae TaxID=598652 RepID=A0A4Q7NPQ6_9ACTN|nr:hydroxyethylthiazole kinase [Motilibacter rhizosphaerae]RZS87038.1 hydroxyethylthiazole kinase [Motilibacter rhizosphaerae]
MAAVPDLLTAVREQGPLVQCITNYVAMDLAANALLAVGASPAMVSDPAESAEFAGIAAALTVNTGTPSPRWVEGMQVAADAAVAAGRPWVLDPVAVGATALRNEICTDLLARRPSVVRGNASEVLALAGLAGVASSGGQGRGVDAGDSVDAALEAARGLAVRSGAVVVVTGPTDLVTDGERLVRITGGSPLMARITATGCALTAVTGAYAAVGGAFDGAVAACAVFAAAGGRAAQGVRGPGSLRVALLDELHLLDQDSFTGVEIEEVA